MESISNWLATLIGAMAFYWFASQLNQAPKKTANVDTQSGERVSLATFIEDNHKLVTTLGAFTALTVFASTLPLKPIGYLLSFLLLTGTVLVWLELWAKFPKSGTNRLIWFKNILSVAVIILIAYWILEFRIIWRPLLSVVLMLVFLWFSSVIIKRFNLFELLLQLPIRRHSILRYLVGIVVTSFSFILASQLSNLLAEPINALLDKVRKQLNSATLPAP